MTARRHHYVPQCYLKGFAEDRENAQLFVADLKTQRSFTTSTENVAAERDFHSIDIEGRAPDSLENAFAEFESTLSPALRRIIDTQSIADLSDRALVYELICSIVTKNPRLRATHSEFRATVARMVMDLATATPERWASEVRRAKRDGFMAEDASIDYATMREFVERGEYKIETPTMEHLRVELGIFERVLPHISQRKWVLFRAPTTSLGFITSDHPVCLMWSNPEERGCLPPPGIGLTKTQLLFPLSRNLAMIGAFELKEEERVVDDSFVAQINGSTLLHSIRQVYAPNGGLSYILNGHVGVRQVSQLFEDPLFMQL